MKVNVYRIDGTVQEEIELPRAFQMPYRPDIIKRVVHCFQSNARQPYGMYYFTGMRRVGHNWGPNHGRSRVPRVADGDRGVISTNMVGGRNVFGPTTKRKWYRKVNKKERFLAKLSALSQTANKDMVKKRGHIVPENITLPVVMEDKLEDINNMDVLINVLDKLGLKNDIERAKRGTRIRAGKGKSRGRKYYTPKSILFVVNNDENLKKAMNNLPGVEIVTPTNLNAEILAPGSHAGRLVVMTMGALENIKGWVL
ncbi:MAG: 50S ribosomal protein L4 [Thermoplasmata archaeon]